MYVCTTVVDNLYSDFYVSPRLLLHKAIICTYKAYRRTLLSQTLPSQQQPVPAAFAYQVPNPATSPSS